MNNPALDKKPTPTIGPATVSTILSKNYRATVDAWCEHLYQHIHSEMVVTPFGAEAATSPDLVGCSVTWLANELNEPWLRIVEMPNLEARTPFKNYGWLSLELAVEDVEQLYNELLDSPFEIIGEPTNSDVSDDIRTMQVVGLEGEVLYLTQIKATLPPLDIPSARCPVDKLFTSVALVPNRAGAKQFYERFEHTIGHEFDTKITAINHALGFETAHRHPVATMQLAGQNMIELDEVVGLEPARVKGQTPLSGIIAISLAVVKLPDSCPNFPHFEIQQGPYRGRKACYVFGAANELIELVEAA